MNLMGARQRCLWLSLMIFGLWACGGEVAPPQGVGLTAALPQGLEATSLAVIIERLDGPDRIHETVPVGPGVQAARLALSLAPGEWRIRATALDDAGEVLASGETTVEVIAGQRTEVTLVLIGGDSGDTGEVDATITLNERPDIEAVAIILPSPSAGAQGLIRVDASDDDGAPQVEVSVGAAAPIVLASDDGVRFVANFVAPALPGTYPVRVVATDARGAASERLIDLVIDAAGAPPEEVVTKLVHLGEEWVLAGAAPGGFGPGTTTFFDLDLDGSFERQVVADAAGVSTFSVTRAQLSAGGRFRAFSRSADGTQQSDIVTFELDDAGAPDPSSRLPERTLAAGDEPAVCTCVDCQKDERILDGASLDAFNRSETPEHQGVELATGKHRQKLEVLSFETRRLGMHFALHYASGIRYDGPVGPGLSHSFNFMVAERPGGDALVVTPDLRSYEATPIPGSETAWALPDGFFSRLHIDTELNRWVLTHFSGLQVELYRAAPGHPGRPVVIRDPHGNETRLSYDASGLLVRITTDLGQPIALRYDAGRLQEIEDHIGRRWTLERDVLHRLVRLLAPATEFAQVEVGTRLTDEQLPDALVTGVRRTQLSWEDVGSQLSRVIDARGAETLHFNYDGEGRVTQLLVGGRPIVFDYAPLAEPAPLALLDEGNRITRVTDRAGNVTDYEIHGEAGGPRGGRGRFGLRREVTWTATGRGAAPLRADEPDYWERRWVHDCDCLRPAAAAEGFSSKDIAALSFDEDGLPLAHPRRRTLYNAFRQPTREEYSDGEQTLIESYAYQAGAFGDEGQFSRRTEWRPPRDFSSDPVDAELSVVHRYSYDDRGNRLRHEAPAVTRGVTAEQPIIERWSYNAFGQPLSHEDANGNRRELAYYEGESSGGDINSAGAFGGYLARTTVGAVGSQDAAPELVTEQDVNALGLVTRRRDPEARETAFVYNDLLELTATLDPELTLSDGSTLRYETRFIYDAAGNRVMQRRSNIGFDGVVAANAFIDQSWAYDALGNEVESSIEVDGVGEGDLVTRYAYDGNDDLIVVEAPEGTRRFRVLDERRMIAQERGGIAPGFGLLDGYPFEAEALSEMQYRYDARRNEVERIDGEGFATTRFFDFRDRLVAERDANGNGWALRHDAAGNVVETLAGAVNAEGRVLAPLARSYARFDAMNRRYLQVEDLDPQSSESDLAEPVAEGSAARRWGFDAGGRVRVETDARGNTTRRGYDAANREIERRDAIGNSIDLEYSPSSNIEVIGVTELEPEGGELRYRIELSYDALDRRIESRELGLQNAEEAGLAPIDHRTRWAYNSRHLVEESVDALGTVERVLYDDANRVTGGQRFDGDPALGGTEVRRSELLHDGNGRLLRRIVLSDPADPTSAQVTRHSYDDLDREIRTIHPDSDDREDGDPGQDGIRDQEERFYDGRSKLVQISDPRGVDTVHVYDDAGRRSDTFYFLTEGVVGSTSSQFEYDALDRLVRAANDHSELQLSWDALSRPIGEVQRVNLAGSGFEEDWQAPVSLRRAYDPQSNRVELQVEGPGGEVLAQRFEYDALNRVARSHASLFGAAERLIFEDRFVGSERLSSRRLGNGALRLLSYDAKQRVREDRWETPAGALLAGASYTYDEVDNPLSERWLHDGGLEDLLGYDARYELVAAEQRTPEGSPGPQVFDYDAVGNRLRYQTRSPFDADDRDGAELEVNAANEYTRIFLTQAGREANPSYDAAGNSTRFPSFVQTADDAALDADLSASWDARNRLAAIDVDPDSEGGRKRYLYDAFDRRVAELKEDGATLLQGSRRFIWDGDRLVSEQIFDTDEALASARSRTEQVYALDGTIDGLIYTEIDRNGDGFIDAAPIGDDDPTADQGYFLASDRSGAPWAVLDDDSRAMEYYRYTLFGEPWVLPALDENGDGIEDTPQDLVDNFERNGRKRSSARGNRHLFSGQRFDAELGLSHMRRREYSPRLGRFLSRDPAGFADGANLYKFGGNSPKRYKDPKGETKWSFAPVGRGATVVTWGTGRSGGELVGVGVSYWRVAGEVKQQTGAVVISPVLNGGAVSVSNELTTRHISLLPGYSAYAVKVGVTWGGAWRCGNDGQVLTVGQTRTPAPIARRGQAIADVHVATAFQDKHKRRLLIGVQAEVGYVDTAEVTTSVGGELTGHAGRSPGGTATNTSVQLKLNAMRTVKRNVNNSVIRRPSDAWTIECVCERLGKARSGSKAPGSK